MAEYFPAIIAAATTTTYTVPPTQPFHYFRIEQFTPEQATTFLINPQLVVTPTQVTMSWSAIPGDYYFVQGKTNITDKTWSPVVGPIQAIGTTITFGTPVSNGFRFFRVVEYSSLPPTTSFLISPQVSYSSTNSFSLSWASIIGDAYFVQGKTNVIDPSWQPVSPQITAGVTTTSFLVPTNSPYRFFRVEEIP